MIDEFARSIRAHLYERITNPLLGAVSVAWVAWNYKLILTLSSSLPLAEKIAFIENTLYPKWYFTILYLIVLPFLSATTFLYIYPIPAKHIFRYTRTQNKELKRIKLEVEDETPASQEEHIQLRRKVNELEARYYTDLTEKDSEISRLREMLSEGSEKKYKNSSDRSREVTPESKLIQQPSRVSDGASKEIQRKKQHDKLVSDGKIIHKKIVGVRVGERKYSLGSEIKSDQPGQVSVFNLRDNYKYEDIIPVTVELAEPLESNQILWVFDGYSQREIEGSEFDLQKADFKSTSARIDVRQDNPLKPGKPLIVSNIVQFQY